VWENNKGDGYTHPKFLRDLPPLPLARKYLLPDKDGVWLHRDFNQQELRTLAHFENGALAARYRERPYRNSNGSMRFDVHSTVQAGILELAGFELNRDHTKIVNFSDIYGKGLTGLAEEIGVDRNTAGKIRNAKDLLMPGVKELRQQIEDWGRAGRPIVTWGGREYYAEPPSYSEKYKRVMDYFYKLLNYEIQPSAADMTKEAIICYDGHPKRESRFLVTVYDEMNVSTPSLKGLSAKAKRDCVAREMAVLRECMETIPVSVPMLSDGKTGPNWAELTKFWNKDEAKEIV
jgi:DNA polymerase I-like protein with 3'-5' exonuclease and polymerase domains